MIVFASNDNVACEQALGLGVWAFLGERVGGRERNESLQRCLRNLNVSVEKSLQKMLIGGDLI